jgi:hypothetical protein
MFHDINPKRFLQNECWTCRVKKRQKMANGISKFESMSTRMVRMTIELNERDKINVLINNLLYSWQSFININNNK